MEEKLSFVSNWLSGLFSGSVPPFEVEEYTINFLYSLGMSSLKADGQLEEYTHLLKRRTEEVTMEAKRLESVLKATQLSAKTLQDEGKKYLESLVAAASALSLRAPDKKNYLVALSDHSLKLSSLEEEVKFQSKETVRIEERMKSDLEALSSLRKQLDYLKSVESEEVSVASSRKQNLTYLAGKKSEYEATLQNLKEMILNSGVTRETTHGSLRKLADQVERMMEETEIARKKVSVFNDLPPDTRMAAVKLEETKRELDRLEKQFEKALEEIDIEGN